jgi:predicted metal-dependent hydrolase
MSEGAAVQMPLWSEPDAPWSVRESERARRMVVRVFHSGRVEVVVPVRTPPRLIATFLERHRQWIEHKRAEASRTAVAPEPFPPASIDLPACAERWRVHLAGGIGRLRLASGGGVISVGGDAADRAALRQMLLHWLLARARDALEPTLIECAREFGFSYARMVIRRQRTRWGSCSVRGTISLNACLLFLPPPVVRYLLIHELAHTRHLNHSRRFWQCVAGCCPEYRRLDRLLIDGWRSVPAWVFGDGEP